MAEAVLAAQSRGPNQAKAANNFRKTKLTLKVLQEEKEVSCFDDCVGLSWVGGWRRAGARR